MWAPQIQAGDVVSGPYAAASTAPIVDARHLGGRRARAAHRRPCGPEDSADRPAGADQRRAGRRHRHCRSAVACATRRCHRISCDSASSASGFRPSSPTPISRCSSATVTSPRWSPMRSRRSSAARRSPSPTRFGTPRPVHQIARETDMSERRPPRYLKPMNRVVKAMQRLGIPTGPAHVLTVPGRKPASRAAPR